MEIRRFDSGLLSSNMYLIEENGHAAVIDPAPDTSPGEGLIVDLLMITHEHYDHIAGVNAWKERYHAPLLCSETCARRIPDPRRNISRHFRAFCELQTWVPLTSVPPADTAYSCEADRTFCGELSFSWQGHRFRLLEIPGHSPGSIGIYLDRTDFFSGDSLLRGEEIELRFPGGSAKEWKESGEPRILEVPEGTVIRPGHFEEFILRRP